jgi:cell division protein ZapA
MAQVEITINSQSYRVACEDGQEQRLTDLARVVDAHVGDLVEQVGQVGHTRLLVMASLMVADELVELREAVNGDKEEATGNGAGQAVEAMDRVSSRLEAIAERLNGA